MNTTTSTWETKTLDELAERIDYGHTASADSAAVGPKFLRITDIQNGHVDWSSVPFCPATPGELNKYRLSDGDIVFARTGNTTGKSFLLKQPPKDSVFASYLIRVRPSSSVDPRYLAHFFDTPDYWNQIKKNSQGAGQPGVNGTRLKTLSIPLPPLSEQKRIADILDKADTIRRKRQETVRIDELIKSVFFDMFGEPLKSAGSDTAPFDHLTSRITYGFTCPMDHVETGIPIITGKNIRDGFIEFGNVHYARQDQFDSLTEKSKPVRGDILIIKDGAIRGRCAILDTDLQICINQSVALVRPNRDRVTPEFLYGYLSSTVVRRKIDNMDKGVAMPHLQITELAKFPVKLPPLEKQEQFSRMYRQALRAAGRISQSMSGLDDLFNSLVQRAFKGQL